MFKSGKLLNRILFMLVAAVLVLVPSNAAHATNLNATDADVQVVELEKPEEDDEVVEEVAEPEKTLVITVVNDTQQAVAATDTGNSDLKINVIEEENAPLANVSLVNNDPVRIGRYLWSIIAIIVLIVGAGSANKKRVEIRRLKVRLKTMY